ncbi:MAG TPA: hypothetical protein VES68_03075 [Candidatus Sulfotelmatobacter sp.]|nr:hypothetical protein [Candidatus Sulfotelmatobacter sp.]
MISKERINKIADRAETAGAYAAILGFAATIVSGVLFIASEPNLTPEAIQRLSTELNVFFEATIGSAIVSGTGATVTLVAEKIKK